MGAHGVVLGNGPSLRHYDFSGDVVIGCNIPGDGYTPDATVIADVEIVWVLKDNPDLVTCPIIVSSRALKKMEELRIADWFDVHYVFKPQDWHCSAHYAALFLINEMMCSRIDIWGCDSFFVDEDTPYLGNHLPKGGSKFYKQWRRTWAGIFTQHPEIYCAVKKA